MKAPARPALLPLAATVLALAVVVMGAYVRLSDAGLGCPDWPGCYGRLAAPSGEAARAEASAVFPERPVETGKAWKEMVHRYLAGVLGLLVLLIAWRAWRRRRAPSLVLPLLLVVLIAVQAALGMWTVTLLLQPAVVMAHLLGGFAVLGLLWWQAQRESGWFEHAAPARSPGVLRVLTAGATAILAAQIALGGWTSANYAALACPDFPTCHGSWWPAADFREGFVAWRDLGAHGPGAVVPGDFEGGVLEGPARVAIHLAHRVGALVTFLYIAALGVAVMRRGRSRALVRTGGVLLLLLAVQVALGIANVALGLPLAVAAAHNAGAALLLLCVLTLARQLWLSRRPAEEGDLRGCRESTARSNG